MTTDPTSGMSEIEKDVYHVIVRACELARMEAEYITCKPDKLIAGAIFVHIIFTERYNGARVGTGLSVHPRRVPHIMTADEMERATIATDPWTFLALKMHEGTKERPRPAIADSVLRRNNAAKEKFERLARELAGVIVSQYREFLRKESANRE